MQSPQVPPLYFGLMQGASVLQRYVPIETGVGFLLWIGLQITASGFEGDPTPEGWRHGPAVAIGLLPSLSAWSWQMISTTFAATRDLLCETEVGGSNPYLSRCFAEMPLPPFLAPGMRWLDVFTFLIPHSGSVLPFGVLFLDARRPILWMSTRLLACRWVTRDRRCPRARPRCARWSCLKSSRRHPPPSTSTRRSPTSNGRWALVVATGGVGGKEDV